MTFDVESHADQRPIDTAPAPATGRERADQLLALGALVAAVTHDLRQPLTAQEMNIAAALQFLKGPTVHLEEALESLRDALVQQSRMRDLLHALDDLAVRREPQRESIDPVPLARDVVSLVGSDALARHASLALIVSPPVDKVYADGTLMRQALLNMVVDALEATSLSQRPEKSVQVVVRQAEDAVEVAVTHYGLRHDAAGIDEWGLALARSVVKAHGGTISLEGDADAGVHLVTRWPTTPQHAASGGSHA